MRVGWHVHSLAWDNLVGDRVGNRAHHHEFHSKGISIVLCVPDGVPPVNSLIIAASFAAHPEFGSESDKPIKNGIGNSEKS